jgi:hypothetical protein
MKRDTTQTIWRTVVFAGAMLGAPACGSKKPQNTTPANNTTPAGDTTNQTAAPDTANQTPDTPGADPCAGGADPCGGERPRGSDDAGAGKKPRGRGFVLA